MQRFLAKNTKMLTQKNKETTLKKRTTRGFINNSNKHPKKKITMISAVLSNIQQ